MRVLSLLLPFTLFGLASISQVQVDKPIQLTGAGADARVTGIQQVSSSQDAASAGIVQSGVLVYGVATGTANQLALSLSPAITSYSAGLAVHVQASAANTGAVTLNINGIGAVPVLHQGAALQAGTLQTGQIYLIIHDGTQFQLVSGTGGGGAASDLQFTLAASPTSATIPLNNSNAASPISVTATYVSGTAQAISFSVTGVPAGVFSSLSPGDGTPNCVSSLVFQVSGSAAPGIYPVVISAYGGAAVQTTTVQLTVVAGKKVFVTSASYDGNLGGISGANNKCQAAATNAGLSGTYKAWVSVYAAGGGASPSTTFTQSSAQYILPNNTVIANNWADLTDGTLQNPINRDEYGNLTSGALVWTQTNTNGTFNTDNCCCGGGFHACGDWTNNSAGTSYKGQYGNTSSTSTDWTNINNSSGAFTCAGTHECHDCNCAKRLYCFEQ